MKTLTIFTPAYNRANCLDKLYNSLCNQSCKNFIWLVIDDGSTDGTRDLVECWMKEQAIVIRYRYKPNGGMHTAHNLAYQLIDTEINTCIDSDDYMPLNAVECILECWGAVSSDKGVAGMLGLDEDTEGVLIGSKLPSRGFRSTLGELYNKEKVTGDKKLVYRSEITKAYPAYPEFIGEKLVPLSWLYTLIDRDYDILCFNSVWVTVDYQTNGSTNTIMKQYFQSPKGFREARLCNIRYGVGLVFRLKNIVHLGVCNIILGDARAYILSPPIFISLLLFPFSICAYFYFKISTKTH